MRGPILTLCGRSVRKSLILVQMKMRRPKSRSKLIRISGMVLNAELRSHSSL